MQDKASERDLRRFGRAFFRRVFHIDLRRFGRALAPVWSRPLRRFGRAFAPVWSRFCAGLVAPRYIYSCSSCRCPVGEPVGCARVAAADEPLRRGVADHRRRSCAGAGERRGEEREAGASISKVRAQTRADYPPRAVTLRFRIGDPEPGAASWRTAPRAGCGILARCGQSSGGSACRRWKGSPQGASIPPASVPSLPSSLVQPMFQANKAKSRWQPGKRLSTGRTAARRAGFREAAPGGDWIA